jgi:hypothetical protein
MSLPDWRTSTKGTRVRVALWLIQEIGEGNTFVKSQLREAFPGVEQVDRRMRDLRPEGWQIHTNQQDPTLANDELRFVKAGFPVWESTGPPPSKRAGLSRSERQSVLRRDEYTCLLCGIGSREAYPDDLVDRAVLLVVEAPSGGWMTTCRRCRADADDFTTTWNERVPNLKEADRQLIAAELSAGRPSSEARLLRSRMWTLSDDARRQLLASLLAR